MRVAIIRPQGHFSYQKFSSVEMDESKVVFRVDFADTKLQ